MVTSVNANLSQRFQSVFSEASKATGTKFDFLMHTAVRESGLKPAAKAPTSSATGLFQFIEQTWLETMKEAGPSLGMGKVADKIHQVGDRYYVKNSADRQAILDLRKDPKTSALMAGAYASKNESLLSARLNRKPSSGELYAAHFLGAQGGGRLIELAHSKPDLAAHKIFPDQARANRNIFFEKNGEAKSVQQVYTNLVGTVPEKPSLLERVFSWGSRFKPKASMQNALQPVKARPDPQDAVAAQANKTGSAAATGKTIVPAPVDLVQQAVTDRFFAKPISTSRFGLGYSASSSIFETPKPSRLVAPNGVGSAERAVGNGTGVVPGQGGRSSRLVRPAEQVAHVAQEAMPLPRRKLSKAEAYADQLSGVLPRAKPKPATASKSLDLSEEQPAVTARSKKTVKRHGALDLTAFLDASAFRSRGRS